MCWRSGLKILTVVGARPQFIKAAAVSRAIREHDAKAPGRLSEVIVHTGQHYDANMSEVFFQELGLDVPRYNLGVGSASHAEQTAAMLVGIEKVCIDETPDVVLIYGDTNSTVAGALAAAKLKIPVAHVEAGLRSFNRTMPEEINRVLADRISTWLFCPTQTAVENLKAEGITDGVHLSGDVMYDSTLQNTELALARSNILRSLGLISFNGEVTPFSLVTVHRAGNTDVPEHLRGIFEALERIGGEDNLMVVPLHPRTRLAMERCDISPRSRFIMLVEPVSYFDMLVLLKHARMVLTDSGGMQKEAYFFGCPCITLRDETEWVETVEAGANVLVGADTDRIEEAANNLPSMGRVDASLYGDGHAGEKILKLMLGID